MSEILNKVITVIGVEKKSTAGSKIFYKIKGDDNKSYQLWQKKQDGTDSKAYESLKQIPDEGLGRAVEIGYKEDQGEYDGKPVTYRTIVSIKLSSEQPDMAQKVARSGMAESKQQAEEEKWDRISFGKCKHAFLLEAFKQGQSLDEAEKGCENWAKASMRILPQEPTYEPMPIEESNEDDFNVDNIL